MNHGYQKNAEAVMFYIDMLNRLNISFPLVFEASGDPGLLCMSPRRL